MSRHASGSRNRPITALVTGAGALLGQGIIRSLRLSQLKVRIVAVDPGPLSVGLYWADDAHLIPMAKDATYLDRLKELLVQEKPDVVLIGTDVELPIIAPVREELEHEFGTHIVVSNPNVIAIADDKWLTYQFLKENGFPYPASSLPGDEQTLIETVGFPLIVKPRVGARSVGVYQVHHRTELEKALETVEDPVIQECVGDYENEYTAGVIGFNGKCPASIVMRRHLRDGNTYRAFVNDYPELNTVVKRLGESLRPYGTSNFQFSLDQAGMVKVFEINARFSGTTPFRALAGFNEVEMVVRHILFGEPVTEPIVEPMTILRYWDELAVRPNEQLSP